MGNIDIRDKTILDLGCSYGHHSFILLGNGAKSAVGVDWGRTKINAVNSISEQWSIKMVGIHDIIENFIKKTTNHWDICLFMNTLHHLLKYDKNQKYILRDIMNHCDVMFFSIGGQFNALKEYDNKPMNLLSDVLPEYKITDLGDGGYRRRHIYKVIS